MGILLALPGLVFAGLGLYLVTLAVASRGARPTPPPAAEPGLRVAVLVPAHDESALVGRCVRSLLAQAYPARLLRVIVIADNCTDDTAAVAVSAGADVVVRTAPDLPGKGHALRWAMDSLLVSPDAPDAIAVVDADSVADANLLAALVGEFEAGHEVVQADYAMYDGGAASGQMASIGFLLFHRVRFAGRHRLGMAANLVGNGMLFSAAVLRREPWDAFTAAEDLEYSIRLRLAGISPRFAPAARVWGPGPASEAGAVRQRMRWEGGRFHVMRTRLPRLIGTAFARRDPRLLDATLDLATPPLGLMSLAVIAGTVLTLTLGFTHVGPMWAVLPWLVAAVAIPAFVVIGLRAAGAPGAAWVVVRRAPGFLAWKLATYLRLARGFDVNRWERTDRAAS